MANAWEALRNGVVLAELGGYGNGPYCAKHGAHAALVMLGTYIVDAGDSVPYPAEFVFKPGRSNYCAYLEEHIATARESGARIGISVVSVHLSDTVEFLETAQDAGADYASLCAHSTMDLFVRTHTSAALCAQANWDHLREWATTILNAVDIPVIFKVGAYDTPDTVGAIAVIGAAGIPIVHVNVDNTDAGSKGLAWVAQHTGQCPFLIVSGGVKDLEGARRVLAAGADAVAIGTAAMDDPDLCGHIQKQLRSV